jgi:hypothetical protein
MEERRVASDATIGRIVILMNRIVGGVLSGTLNPETILRCLNEILKYSVPIFQYDMRKKGWNLVTNHMDINYPIPCLELVEIPAEGAISLRKCLDQITGQYTVLNQHQAEYLLVNQAIIPETWQEKKIFFTGTVWRDEKGNLKIPFIEWKPIKRMSTGKWEIHFEPLDIQYVSVLEIWDCVVPRLIENSIN